MRLPDLLRAQPMSLLVSLPTNTPDLARAAVEAGADALKVHIHVHHRASGTCFGSLAAERDALVEILRIAGDRPVGLVAGGDSGVPAEEVVQAVAMGLTMISMYAHHMPAAWFAIPGADFMLASDCTYTEGEIAALGGLSAALIEASIIHPDGYGRLLTARDLLQYRMVASLVPQPVVVPSQRRLVPEDLRPLAQIGVRAVMIGAVVTGRGPDEIYAATAAFRKTVDSL